MSKYSQLTCSGILYKSTKINNEESKITGIESKKENFIASLYPRPNNNPAVIVTPLLEVPGINANA